MISKAAIDDASAQLHVLMQQAVRLHQDGDLVRAKILYEEVLKIRPTNADACHLLGLIAAQTQQPARAVELIQKSLTFDSANFAAYGNLGSAFYALGRLPEALSAYDRAIALKPDFEQAYLLRGNVLYELKRYEPALASYDAAIASKPKLAQAHSNRSNALQALGRLDEALAGYERAIALNPLFVDAHCNRGNVLRELDRFEAALASYDRALAIDARSVPAHFNRGVALNQLRLLPEALAAYEAAIAVDPDFAEAHFNRAVLWLLTGDFSRGWVEYEWRWKNRLGSNIHEKRDFGVPLWLGEESLAGSTILLYGEQGFGDSLQLCRYVKLVADLGATVILEVPQALAAALAELEGVARLVTRGEDPGHIDYQCPLMSLPLALGTDLDTIPASRKYLHSDPAKVLSWEKLLGEKTLPRIGLMWNGNPVQPNDRNRSVWLGDWLRYLPQGFQYVCLQAELRAGDARTLEKNPQIFNPAGKLRDFSDTAALCDCMDLVISVCTSVAHLSGALGKQTWVLLAFAADWRWLLHRNDTPWYASATLYRQPSKGDWTSVFQRVQRDLHLKFP